MARDGIGRTAGCHALVRANRLDFVKDVVADVSMAVCAMGDDMPTPAKMQRSESGAIRAGEGMAPEIWRVTRAVNVGGRSDY